MEREKGCVEDAKKKKESGIKNKENSQVQFIEKKDSHGQTYPENGMIKE